MELFLKQFYFALKKGRTFLLSLSKNVYLISANCRTKHTLEMLNFQKYEQLSKFISSSYALSYFLLLNFSPWVYFGKFQFSGE